MRQKWKKWVWKYFLQYIKEIKILNSINILWVIFVTSVALITPIYIKDIIDIISHIDGDKQEVIQQIMNIFWKFVWLILLSTIVWRILDYSLEMSFSKIDYTISIQVFDYIHKHSHNFFINNFAWAINSKIAKLVTSMQSLYSIFIWDITRFIISFLWICIVLLNQNLLLWLFFFGYIIIFIGVSYVLNKFRLPYIEKASKENSYISWVYADSIVNNYNISLFGTLEKEKKNMMLWLNKWIWIEKKSIIAYGIVFWILWVLALLWEISMMYSTIILWEKGKITVWTFVLVLTYQIIISSQIFTLSFLFGRIGTSVWKASEMIEILNTPHEIVDKNSDNILKVSEGKIYFQNISFYYNADKQVFKDFNLVIHPWEKVGIVWVSWSWKTSLLKLLFRFYDIPSGVIMIDWQDISNVTQASLRKNISMVPQDTILFHRSLKENIGYGKENASLEEIIEVAKKANCHQFISKLPEWYDTLVGERWVKLSGWERQRVSIARAMLQNNKILVLDEATSALDSESESLIQEALEYLMQDKTMLVIAHRLSTIMKMDRIIVMEWWRIIEEGTHQKLIDKSWTYKKLWDIQSWWFLEE